MAGRPRKFQTGKALEKAVNAYFDAISYEEPVTRRVRTGKKDKNGHDRYRDEPVIARNGIQAQRTMWTEPPSISGLCLRLGICRDTWAEMAGNPVFSDTVTRARGRIEAYLESRLEEKGARGVIFNLQQNYGWKERTEISVDEETRKSMEAARMPISEKMKLLEEMGLRIPTGKEGE